MPSPMTLSQAADLIDLSIQKVWLKPTYEKTEFYKKMYNVTTGVVDYYMKDSSISGLGSAARVVESASIVSESPVQGYKQTLKTAFNLAWGL